MIAQKQKNTISYELYAAKKKHEPDHLCSLIRKHQKQMLKENIEADRSTDLSVRKHLNEKRVQQIMKEYRKNQVSTPNSYIKRTWISPLLQGENKQNLLYCLWKKNNIDRTSSDQ